MQATQGWYPRVEALYQAVDREVDPHQHLCLLRGVCCDFRRSDHRLYATELEVRYAREQRRRAGLPNMEPEAEGLCPFWQKGRCHAREARPLGCRTYFCDPGWKLQGEEIHARFHAELQEIGRSERVPYDYGLWVDSFDR